MKPLLTIAIPFKNEEESIPNLLEELKIELKRTKEPIEFWLVNDGSTDKTQELLIEFEERYDRVHLVNHLIPEGQSRSLGHAFNYSKSEYFMQMDGDGQDNPKDIKLFIEEIKKGNEIIVGVRTFSGHKKLNQVASKLFDIFMFMFWRSPFISNTGSMMCYKRSLLTSEDFERRMFMKNPHRYLVLFALKRNPKRVSEVLVHHRSRTYGRTNYNRMKKYFGCIMEVVYLLFKKLLTKIKEVKK